MSISSVNIKQYTHTGRQISPQEAAFISSYVLNKNATLAAQEAGYKAKNMAQQGIVRRARVGVHNR